MAKTSLRMASVSREPVFDVQTSRTRKIHRSGHTEGRLTTTPSRCTLDATFRRQRPDVSTREPTRQTFSSSLCNAPFAAPELLACHPNRCGSHWVLHRAPLRPAGTFGTFGAEAF